MKTYDCAKENIGENDFKIPNKFKKMPSGNYRIMLSDFYTFEIPTFDTAEVSEEVLIEMIKSKRLEKRLEMRDFRHCVPFEFDENISAALEGIMLPSAEEVYLSNCEIAKLEKALEELNSIQLRRISMMFFENYTLTEIAAIENVSINAVRLSILNALVMLKELLSEIDE